MTNNQTDQDGRECLEMEGIKKEGLMGFFFS